MIHSRDLLRDERYRYPRPSLNELDQKLKKFLNFNKGFFIEVGANNGIAQSNTYYLEKEQGWTGILIEGIPELYRQCVACRDQAMVFQRALVADAKQQTVTMHYADLMSCVTGSMKTKEQQDEHIQAGLKMQCLKNSYIIEVPACTLESILETTPHLTDIHFFSLDVEGGELNVLKGMNITKYRPWFILVEARFFNEVNTFLTEHRYRLIEKLTVHDCLYQRI